MKKPGKGITNIDTRLAINIRNLYRTVRDLFDDQKRVLILLYKFGPLTFTGLKRRLLKGGIYKEGNPIDEAERKLRVAGYVETEWHFGRDSDDKSIISLTAKGKWKARSILNQYKKLTSILTREEKEQLLALLEKLNNS